MEKEPRAMKQTAKKRREKTQGGVRSLAAWLRSQAQPAFEPATAAPSGDSTSNADSVKKKLSVERSGVQLRWLHDGRLTRTGRHPRSPNQSIMLSLSGDGRRAVMSLKPKAEGEPIPLPRPQRPVLAYL